MAFQAGYSKGVTFKPTGQTAFATINVTGWSWEEEVERLITTHTGSAGIQACLAGIFDMQGTFTANVDAAALPSTTPTPLIRAGTQGTLTMDVGAATNGFSVPILITKVPWKSSVNGLVSYECNYALDSSQGSIVYPL